MAALAVALTVTPASATPGRGEVKDPVSYVNPLIGSSNAGNTYPGAVQPFGMLAWSPQNSRGSQTSTPAPGGYQYNATKIRGFSLTHLNGVGCSGANGDIPIMPYVGDVDSSPRPTPPTPSTPAPSPMPMRPRRPATTRWAWTAGLPPN